jgi:N-acetylneuraminate lyase
MTPLSLEGLIAATTTSFTGSGEICTDVIGPMIDRLIESGVDGLYVCGSTGEGMSLTCDERKRVVEATVEAAKGRVPVIVQVGHNSLKDARGLAEHAALNGAAAISATCPSYFKIGETETLVACMAEIATAAPQTPFYYYHIPSLTGSSIDVADFLRRGGDKIESLVGLKYTDTLLHQFQQCLHLDRGRFNVLWGCDEMLLGALATGARGAIGSTYNIAAPLYKRLIAALAAGEMAVAQDLQNRSVEMVNVMKRYPFHAALKSIMEMLGMSGGACRLPLRDLAGDEVQTLRRQLESIGFFEWCGHHQPPQG